MDLKRCFWIVLAIFFIAQSCFAEVMEFRVSQVFQQLPKIDVYLHLTQESGQPIENIEGVKFSAFVDADSVAITSTNKFDADSGGVAYLFLVDVSKSLNAAQFREIKEALSNWVNSIKATDRAGLMTFGTTVRTVQDFTADKELLTKAVNGLALTDMDTQLHLGLARAIELSRRKDADLPGRRAIITLSDGQDDFVGGMTKNEVLNQLKDDPIPIYAIGFVKQPVTQAKESYLKTLGEFARTSGGLYFNAGNFSALSEIYKKVRQSTLDVWVAQLDCKDCPADGTVHRLQMSMESGSRTITDGQNIRLLPIAPAVDETTPVTPLVEETATEETQSEQTQVETTEPEPASAQAVIQESESPEATTQGQESPQPLTPESELPFWEKIPSWAWLVAVILLFGLFMLILFFKKKSKALQNQLNLQTQSNPKEQIERVEPEKDELDEQPEPAPSFETTKRATIINSPPAIQIKLTIVGGSNSKAYSHNLVESLTIGRSKLCDIAITDDDQISSRHCQLIQRDKGVYLKELGATNGTMVNGVHFNGMNYLQNGDLILVGRTELRITYKKG
ncbi:MAG: VWA domain-containing protein [Desulfamplus sp.]|nr:VWA domain-containing protein [Desulfamplus sp.]